MHTYIHIYCVVIYTFIYSDFVNGFKTPSVGYIISISPQIYLKCLQFIWFHSFSGIWRGFYLFTRSVHNIYIFFVINKLHYLLRDKSQFIQLKHVYFTSFEYVRAYIITIETKLGLFNHSLHLHFAILYDLFLQTWRVWQNGPNRKGITSHVIKMSVNNEKVILELLHRK